MNIRFVDSLHLPELEAYRTLKRPLEHQLAGFFVAEGEKVVRRLLESHLRVRSLLLTQEWLDAYQPLLKSRTEAMEIYVSEKRVMEEIVGFRLHKGVMAIADIPKAITMEEASAASMHPHLFVAVDGIMNSENLGVIARNCASFGVNALLVGENSCDPYLRRAVRNSMGSIFTLPIVRLSSIAAELAQIRDSFGLRLIGAHPRNSSSALEKVDFKRDCCVVFGAEGEGISGKVLALCDELATIPMLRGVDSINVGSASAVVLYEVQCQRRH